MPGVRLTRLLLLACCHPLPLSPPVAGAMWRRQGWQLLLPGAALGASHCCCLLAPAPLAAAGLTGHVVIRIIAGVIIVGWHHVIIAVVSAVVDLRNVSVLGVMHAKALTTAGAAFATRIAAATAAAAASQWLRLIGQLGSCMQLLLLLRWLVGTSTWPSEPVTEAHAAATTARQELSSRLSCDVHKLFILHPLGVLAGVSNRCSCPHKSVSNAAR